MTKVGLYDIGTSTPLESNKSLRPLPWSIRMACCVQSISSSVRWTTSETRRPHHYLATQALAPGVAYRLLRTDG